MALPPEIYCRIYRNITNFQDIQNLITAYRNDPEELALIYSCITRIENVPFRPHNFVTFNFINNFPNLRDLRAPIYLENFQDICLIPTLQKLTKATFIPSLSRLSFEGLINHIVKIIPKNIERIYFSNFNVSILYHYDRIDEFFAISTHNIDTITDDNITDIHTIMNNFVINELYLQIPEDSEYIEDIVNVTVSKYNGNVTISCPSNLLRRVIHLASSIVIRYQMMQSDIYMIDLDDALDFDIDYPNVVELHGPFSIDSIVTVQNQFPNLQMIGFYLRYSPFSLSFNEISSRIQSLNPNIQAIVFYADFLHLPVIKQYFTQALRQSRFFLDFRPIDDLQDFSIYLYFDANVW